MFTLSLKCSNCGGDLKIGSDVEHFACGYCGSSQVVHRDGGIVTLKAVEAAIAKVQLGTDRTAAELAVRRLKDDLDEVGKKVRHLVQANIAEKERSQAFLAKAAAIVGIIPFLWILFYSTGWAVLWAVVVFAITLYLMVQSRSRIDGRYQTKLNPLFEREDLLKKRLIEQTRVLED